MGKYRIINGKPRFVKESVATASDYDSYEAAVEAIAGSNGPPHYMRQGREIICVYPRDGACVNEKGYSISTNGRFVARTLEELALADLCTDMHGELLEFSYTIRGKLRDNYVYSYLEQFFPSYIMAYSYLR